MIKLNNTLNKIKLSRHPGFMMHIVAGYPDMHASKEIATTLLETGADILEIQIPFSDPVADGPVIASANERSLDGGTTVSSSLGMISEICANTDKPVLIMSYFNIIHRYGIEDFCARAAEIGVQGLIVPDYPHDEETGNSLLEYCEKYELALIQVVASTTKVERIQAISKVASGFVYCVARTGITGNKTAITPETTRYLDRVRSSCPLPLAVGFGLSEKSQVQALSPHAEIMIVGSALIRQYADKSLSEGLEAVISFMNSLRSDL